jgi:hypothetical protein
MRTTTVLPVDAELFVERGPNDLVSGLLSPDERYTGQYYLAAYKRDNGGYQIGVIPVLDQTYPDKIKQHLAVEDLKLRGYGLRGVKSDRETLDQNIFSWLEGPRKRPIHDFVVMVTADGREIGIDEAIVLLIEELWSHGVRTDSSCQGGYATLYGAQPGYVNYNAEDHEAVVGVIEEAGLTGVEYLQGPSEKRYLETVEFDPVP